MNMKKVLLILLAMLLAMPAAAVAEVYLISGEAELPEGWAERETLRMTVVDTNRSDAIILQCGGEAMMVDGGPNPFREDRYKDCKWLCSFSQNRNLFY